MNKSSPDLKRRTLLNSILGGVTAIGALLALVPFVRFLSPSDLAKSLGAPVEVNLGDIAEGGMKIVEWRGKPVWIIRRSSAMLDRLADNVAELADPESKISKQPQYISGDARAIKPEYLVLVGICTHLGCSPTYKPQPGDAELGADWPGGFFCPCHGSHFDMSGRVFRQMPAPTNLEVPPYKYADTNTIIIGES